MSTYIHNIPHNGWANHATWNVALWIQNDEVLYAMARSSDNYPDFVQYLECTLPSYDVITGWNPDEKNCRNSTCTPDGIKWREFTVDVPALDKLIDEIDRGDA